MEIYVNFMFCFHTFSSSNFDISMKYDAFIVALFANFQLRFFHSRFTSLPFKKSRKRHACCLHVTS